MTAVGTEQRRAGGARGDWGRGELDRLEHERAESLGFGPLQPLFEDPSLTDVYVNAPDEVWTDGPEGLRRTEVRFDSDDAVAALAVRVIGAAGRRLDAGHPCTDVQTRQGYRVHAVLPPISPGHVLLSIRRQPEYRPGFSQLQRAGLCGQELADLLRAVVRARLGFLISGSTGTGKTTLLNALLGLCPAEERIVMIEDSAELAPDHPHAVGLQTRPPNAEGAGGIGLTELIRQSLRMGPDRIVLGEVRGEEVKDLLTALNTGHEGGGGTIHANSAAAVSSRLLALGALAGMSPEAVDLQAATAVDVVIHLERTAAGRRVAQLGMLLPDERRRVRVLDAATEDERRILRPGPAWDELVRRLGERGVVLPGAGGLGERSGESASERISCDGTTGPSGKGGSC